ncbi:hypothetical protein ACJX0J_027555, partial [Zea mays]
FKIQIYLKEFIHISSSIFGAVISMCLGYFLVLSIEQDMVTKTPSLHQNQTIKSRVYTKIAAALINIINSLIVRLRAEISGAIDDGDPAAPVIVFITNVIYTINATTQVRL